MKKQAQVLAWSETGREAALQRAAEIWRRGGLVVIPTDTVYGLAADPRHAGAVENLWAVKGRDLEKKIALLAADQASVRRAASGFDALAQRLADAFWPGPLTLVLPTPEGAEGFRVPDDPAAIALLYAAGGLLRVTSANRSGAAPARTAAEALQALGDAADLIIDAGPARGGVPSTVVVIEGNSLRITREGALGSAEIRAAAGLTP
jgi:L-threonylcarbamoyladenylate synthase